MQARGKAMINCVWTETLRGNKDGERAINPWASAAAGQRYAVAIARLFGADIIHDKVTYQKFAPKKYDVVFVGYSTIYSEYKADAELIKRQSRASVVHVSTEYENACPASLYYAKRNFLHVANYEKIPPKQTTGGWLLRDKFVHCNVNSLLYRGSWRGSVDERQGCIYWGRFRPDRAIYLADVARAGVTISTSPKNIDEWKRAGVNASRWVDKVSWQPGYETIRNYAYTVYCEDSYTHTNYNCPANRWYEALDADVQPLVHTSAMPTFARSGYCIHDDAVYDTANDLERKIATASLRNALRPWRDEMREIAKAEKKRIGEQLTQIVTDYVFK
jgi:hypothetical protein